MSEFRGPENYLKESTIGDFAVPWEATYHDYLHVPESGNKLLQPPSTRLARALKRAIDISRAIFTIATPSSSSMMKTKVKWNYYRSSRQLDDDWDLNLGRCGS